MLIIANMPKVIDLAKSTVSILMIVCWLGIQSIAQAAEESVSVRVASYNVEFGKNASPEEIGEMFKPYQLDVIGFSEVPGGDWTERVGRILGMEYTYVGEISSANHKDKYKSLLSRTPLTKTHEITIDAKGWAPASMVGAQAIVRRVPIFLYSRNILSN